MVKSTKKTKPTAGAVPAPEEVKTLGRELISPGSDARVESDDVHVAILSYNILAQRYVRSTFFVNTPSYLLKWKRRGADVVKSLVEFMLPSGENTLPVDLLCLQEVDWFTEFYRPELMHICGEKGRPFGFCYKKRTSESSVKFDGSCVLFSKNRFALIEVDHLEFNDLAKDEHLFELKKARDLARPTLDSKTVDFFTRDCVAAICVLEDEEANQRFLVASAHLFWDPECTDVKILQAMKLLQKLNEVAVRHDLAGVFLGGDFNSTPNSAPVELLTTGRLAHDHPDAHNIPKDVVDYVNNSLEDCKQIPSLLSAYTYKEGKQPGCRDLDVDEISTLTKKFSGNLDYIFYRDLQSSGGEDTMRVSKILSLPTVKSCHQDRVTALPAFGHPSDHLPLLASLQIPSQQN